MAQQREMKLTAAHVALVHREIGPQPVPDGVQMHDDTDYADWVARILSSHPARAQPTRLFAFGSLIWRPEVAHVAEEVVQARGWHRSFCLRMTRFRATPEVPGLMMALDRGGQCKGVAYTLPQQDLPGQLDRLFRREFTAKPINNMPRWIRVELADGSNVPALAFVMNRASPAYAGRVPPDAAAAMLARACGQWGSGAEYLLNTVSHLEARGIHDRMLWRLQAFVADRIAADHAHPD